MSPLSCWNTSGDADEESFFFKRKWNVLQNLLQVLDIIINYIHKEKRLDAAVKLAFRQMVLLFVQIKKPKDNQLTITR